MAVFSDDRQSTFFGVPPVERFITLMMNPLQPDRGLHRAGDDSARTANRSR
jgi:hypothetical protein